MIRTLGAVAVMAACVLARAQDLPGMAAGIIQQSQLARQAVDQHDFAAALDHLDQASALASSILRTAPPEPRPVLVEVYRDTDTTTTYAPAKKSRDGKFRTDRLKKDTTAKDVDAQVTTGRLDVTSAAAHLATATTAVMRQDWTIADSELGAIPQSIIRTRVEGSMPLLEARQNLRLARMRVLEGKFKEASVPLRAAARDLADYEKLSPGPRAQDAEHLREQIEAYSRTIAQDHANAAGQIDAWIGPIETWNQQVSE